MGEKGQLEVIEATGDVTSPLARAREQASEYIRQAKAPNTLRAYRTDWTHFSAWCRKHGVIALPAEPGTVGMYLSAYAGKLKCSTLQRRISAISQAHQAANHPTPTGHPTVRNVWQGIRRAHGSAYSGKTPALTADIRRMVDTLPAGLVGTRDRALLLLGFAGAFRRSELVGLDREDLSVTNEGITVTLRRSKTDQEGQGRKVGIPYGSRPHTCPVRAMLAWYDVSGIATGPVFRAINRHGQLRHTRLTAQVVALIVKRYAEAAGLNPDLYAGHSLRAGLATSAASAGVSERAIMEQTGHKSVTMVRRYIREGSLFRENAAAQVGL